MGEDDKIHYVDVKATTGEDFSFEISTPEVRFGEEHKSDYEIIMVQNALTPERKAVNLGKIFEYSGDESFNSNSKFSVENDGFRIRFEIKEQGANKATDGILNR